MVMDVCCLLTLYFFNCSARSGFNFWSTCSGQMARKVAVTQFGTWDFSLSHAPESYRESECFHSPTSSFKDLSGIWKLPPINREYYRFSGVIVPTGSFCREDVSSRRSHIFQCRPFSYTTKVVSPTETLLLAHAPKFLWNCDCCHILNSLSLLRCYN